MKVSKLLVSSLLCGTLLTSPVAKANLLADIGKYFLIGTGIYVSYRAVKAAAEATGNGEFQKAVNAVGEAMENTSDAAAKLVGTVGKSAGDLVALAVDKTAEAIKGEENLDGKNSIKHEVTLAEKDANINDGNDVDKQIIADNFTPGKKD